MFEEPAAWTGFSTLVGFLVVFRTSQAYSRFWDGCTATYMMQTEWFDACSSIVAFCKYSKAAPDVTSAFQHTLIRLFSMLHALALAEIEDSSSTSGEARAAFHYELIDIEALDTESLRTLKTSDCKVELVFQWIQQLLVENIETSVLAIPPPILSRAFQELATGMVQFHDALKISSIPFPFPYAQTCDVLLMVHSLGTPFVMVHWVSKPWWAFLLSFTQVFVFWCLNYISIEIQNPFGSDANDIDASFMQDTMNAQLLLLLAPSTKRTPKLKAKALQRLRAMDPDCSEFLEKGLSGTFGTSHSKKSFSSVFTEIDSGYRKGGSMDSMLNSERDDYMSSEPRSEMMQHLASDGGRSVGLFGEAHDSSFFESFASDGSGWNLQALQRDLHDVRDDGAGGGWHQTMRRLMEAQGMTVDNRISSCSRIGGASGAALPAAPEGSPPLQPIPGPPPGGLGEPIVGASPSSAPAEPLAARASAIRSGSADYSSPPGRLRSDPGVAGKVSFVASCQETDTEAITAELFRR